MISSQKTYQILLHLPKLFLLLFLLLPSQSFADFKIGVTAPLSGDLAEYGAAVRNGIELATKEQPARFSNLQFRYEDNEYLAEKAISAFRKLTDLDKVDLIYNWGEPTLHAIAPLAEAKGLPVIAMSLDPVPALNRHFIIRSIDYSEQYALHLLRYLRKEGFKKIGIFKTEDPFLNSMVDGLQKHLKEGESLKVIATFNPGDTDFKPHLPKLRAAGYDVIGVYLFTGQVSVFYKQAASLGLKFPSFGTDFFESKTEIADANGNMDGAVYPNIAVPQSFVDAYQKEFKNDLQIAYAYNAYTFAKLTSALLNDKSAPLSGEDLINLYAKPPTGFGFNFRDTAKGGRFYEFPLVIRKISGSEIVNVR